MKTLEKKVPGLTQEPETTFKQINYNTNFTPDEDISEPSPEESPEDISRGIIPLNSRTKYFYEQLTGVEVDLPETETKNPSCPKCPKILKVCSRYLNGEWEDYLECECGYTTKKKKLFSNMPPTEVLDRIEAGEV